MGGVYCEQWKSFDIKSSSLILGLAFMGPRLRDPLSIPIVPHIRLFSNVVLSPLTSVLGDVVVELCVETLMRSEYS